MNPIIDRPGGDAGRNQHPDTGQPPSAPTPFGERPPRRSRRPLLLLLLVLLPLSVYGWNYLTLQRKMAEVMEKDPRNKGVEVSVHYKTYVNPSVLVYDLRGISGTNSRLDVTRVLLQFAEQVKDRKFERVELAFRGGHEIPARRRLLPGARARVQLPEPGLHDEPHTREPTPPRRLKGLRVLDGRPAGGLHEADTRFQRLPRPVVLALAD